jgi:hypothetical protein
MQSLKLIYRPRVITYCSTVNIYVSESLKDYAKLYQKWAGRGKKTRKASFFNTCVFGTYIYFY